jgi:hypothetical protein
MSATASATAAFRATACLNPALTLGCATPIFREAFFTPNERAIMEEESVSCARVTSSVAGEQPSETSAPSESATRGEVKRMGVTVGQKAPDFTAPAYYKGKFTNVKLSDHAGKWVMLCFYPGDFTFV